MVVIMRSLVASFVLLTTSSSLCSVGAFTVPQSFHRPRNSQAVGVDSRNTNNNVARNNIVASSSSSSSSSCLTMSSGNPQVFATGYSSKSDLMEAIVEAVDQATASLPKLVDGDSSGSSIDLAWITTSSLYDAQSSPNIVVPSLLSSSLSNRRTIQNVIGCSTGGIVSCRPTSRTMEDEKKRECIPLETEGLPGVSVTLCLLPDVDVTMFHIEGEDVPDDLGKVPVDEWKRAVGLSQLNSNSDDHNNNNSKEEEDEIFMLMPSAAFQKDLDDLVNGLKYAFPSSTTLGAVASTVSSLSRARLFCYSAAANDYNTNNDDLNSAYGDGCVGVALKGDIQVKVSVAQGAKPVGGVYRVVSGQDSTIAAIQLDEAATQQEDQTDLFDDTDEDDDDDDDTNGDDEDAKKKKQIAQAYAKASIPKPVLAEANYLMKTLSDDDREFMSRALLVGLERGGAMGQSPSQLVRLAQGKGHSFTVHQVASAGMKDGSVTLPLGLVNIERGTRLRFFIREGKFAKKELEALWTGYKKQILEETFLQSNDDTAEDKKMFTPTGCIMLTTLDRGSKLFGGKAGYETSVVSDFLPSIPSISGFYSNGVIAKLDNQQLEDANNNDDAVMIHGSASCFALFGSKTGRPVYLPSQAAAIARQEQAAALEAKNDADGTDNDDNDNDNDNDNDEGSQQPAAVMNAVMSDNNSDVVVAPRDENNELILRRREVHSGRSLTVSTVEWSVAENVATPTSVLESFMWEKETEVDRLRERVPLSNLVSQWSLSLVDPSISKPRDWAAPVKQALENSDDKFVIIPECKRLEPATGSLRKRYNLSKLVKQLTIAGAPAISVNCDAILYGGKLEDITTARDASKFAALSQASEDDAVVLPPILASDLILYPYQLYKLRLAGADAANLQVAALDNKDLLYMTKIASSLKMQLIASVTSEIQIEKVTKLSTDKNSIRALVVSNRDVENFSMDETGEQALRLLKSHAMEEFRAKHKDILILVEGRVGIIERESSSSQYIKELIEANANGAIVASGLATKKEDDGGAALKGILMDVQNS